MGAVVDPKLVASLSGLGVDLERLASLSGHERSVAEDELRLLEQAFKANPLLGYRPHSKQVEFHQGPWPSMRCFFGGNRSGKTTAAVLDTILQAVDESVVPEHLKAFKRWTAPFRCRFVTPDLTSTLEGVVLEKLRSWCPREQLEGNSFDRAWSKQLRTLKFKNGSWFQFVSNDQDRDKLGGSDLHRVVYDEEPRYDIRQECLTRLIDHDGEEIFAMTPLFGMSWLFEDVYEPWERGELQDGRVTIVDMDDNPHLSESGKARALAQYTGEEREARKSGRFVHFAGLIYPQFSRGRHVLPDVGSAGFKVPAGAEVFAGIDPGVRHMAAVLFAYLDSYDHLVVFDEVAMQSATVRDVCREIKMRCARWDVRPAWFVIDPASRNKGHQTGRSDQQEYADHGIFTVPGQNEVAPGINRVRERLEHDRLHVMANCQELIGEFKKYRWQSNSRSEGAAKEEPVKKDDHLLDALRYIVMQRPLAPSRASRPETLTMKDRLLRHSLERLKIGKQPEHPSGPGIFA